jgi:aryl-alcohol dehydrogenase
MAAVVANCATIIAVDRNTERLRLARELGATHIVDATTENAVEVVRRLIDGGVDYAVEAAGVGSVMTQAVQMLGSRGTAALVGVTHDPMVDIPIMALQSGGQTVKGSLMGGAGATPSEFIPRLIRYWREGRFPIEKLIRAYSFCDINTAIADARSGATIKPVIHMPS